MKKLIFLVLIAFTAFSASAQITWNTKAGFGVANCWGDAEGLKMHIVGKIGAGIEKPFSPNWSLMPSLEIAMKGTEFDGGKVDIFYVQVPIVAAYRLNLNDNWNMTIKAGPYFAYGFYGSVNDTEYDESYSLFSDEMGGKRFDAGLDLGLDFEYHRFVFGVEYEFGVLPLIKEESDKIYNSAFYATIGYKF